MLVGTLLFGVIGFVDDYMKLVVKQLDAACSASSKFFWQIVGALGAAFAFYCHAPTIRTSRPRCSLPFFKKRDAAARRRALHRASSRS